MKGPLSVLSAAVLFALAGSNAGATQPAIQQPVLSKTPPTRPASRHRKAPAGNILYDQTAGMTGLALPAGNFTTSTYAYMTSQGADDFVVPGGQTWTVNGFVLPMILLDSVPPASGNPQVWPDADGRPGGTMACDGSNTPITFANSEASMTLATPCELSSGRYWLVFAANVNMAHHTTYWNVNGPVANQAALWQSPGSITCPSWGDFDTCFPSAPSSAIGGDFAFQVIGNAFAASSCDSSSPTCLKVGMALYNSSNPTECGTATSLSVTAGDTINYCYTFTNNTSNSLDYHSLADNIDGNLFTLFYQAIPGGGSTFQYNRIGSTYVPGTFMHTATWTAQGAHLTYDTWTSEGPGVNPYFIDITGSGTLLNLFSSDAGMPVALPFSFPLYDEVSNAICVNKNGFIQFDTTSSCPGFFSNVSLPVSAFSTPMIFPFWDDIGSAGEVYFGTPTSATDPFVVEWHDVGFWASSSVSPPYTFEVQLHRDGTIAFAYEQVSGGSSHDNGISATIGLQKDGSLANEWSYDLAVIDDYLTLFWKPASLTKYAASAFTKVNIGAPVVTVSPTTLSGSAESGDTTMVALAIGNTGNRDLAWNLDEAPGSARPGHFPRYPVQVTPPAHATASAGLARRHADPQKHANALAAAHRRVAHRPTGQPTVLAFGEIFTPFGTAYVGLDASNPGALQTITPAMSTYYFAGTFASNDFSTEYAVSYPGGNLDTIDTATGAIQTIGNTGLGGSVTGIRWDPTTGDSYAMAVSCGSASSTLYTLDLGTGATTLVGNSGQTDCIIDIAIDPQGNMYGVDIVSDSLVAIDKSTGASATIGSLGVGVSYAEGMDFDQSSGTLYFAGWDTDTRLGTMYTIDTTTGLATEIGLIGPNGDEMDAFAIAVASGPCTLPSDVPWLSEDVTSGTTTAGNTSMVNVTMDATSLAAGTYTGNVCVTSNDLTRSRIAVPVTFTVTGNDTLFKNGFDP